MAAITKAAAAAVKPLEGATVIRGTLGATTTAPSPVTLQSDGKWDPSTAAGVQVSVGVAVQSGGDTDVVDIVIAGRVLCLSGATPGAIVYSGDTAGTFDTATGTKGLVIGFAESASVLFVQPQIVSFS